MAMKTDEIFELYYQDVYRYLLSCCRDASLAEELAAEVFLEAVRSLVRFRGDSHVKTWLFSIARHRWFKYLERKKINPPAESLTELLVDPGKNPEQIFLNRELADRIQQLLSSEPERSQTIVNLRLEGYSFYDIAQKVGISESSARVIDCRTRAKLREILKKEGFSHDENHL